MRFVVYLTLLALACGYALLRGGGPERIVAAAMLVASGATIILGPHFRAAYQGVLWGEFATDAVLLLVLVVLAIVAERFWPIWIAGLQLIAVSLHLLRFLDPGMMRSVYSIVQAVWAYPMLLCLALGTMRHQQRLRDFGSDKSWSIS